MEGRSEWGRLHGATFTDFLEALARVALAAPAAALPTRQQLAAWGAESAFEYHARMGEDEFRKVVAASRAEEAQAAALAGQDAAAAGPALPDRLAVLVDLVFRQLHYDPVEGEGVSLFTPPSLLRKLREKAPLA